MNTPAQTSNEVTLKLTREEESGRPGAERYQITGGKKETDDLEESPKEKHNHSASEKKVIANGYRKGLYRQSAPT